MEVIDSGDWKGNLAKLGTALAKGRGAEEVGERDVAIRHYREALALLAPVEGGTIRPALEGRLAILTLATGRG